MAPQHTGSRLLPAPLKPAGERLLRARALPSSAQRAHPAAAAPQTAGRWRPPAPAWRRPPRLQQQARQVWIWKSEGRIKARSTRQAGKAGKKKARPAAPVAPLLAKSKRRRSGSTTDPFWLTWSPSTCVGVGGWCTHASWFRSHGTGDDGRAHAGAAAGTPRHMSTPTCAARAAASTCVPAPTMPHKPGALAISTVWPSAQGGRAAPCAARS